MLRINLAISCLNNSFENHRASVRTILHPRCICLPAKKWDLEQAEGDWVVIANPLCASEMRCCFGSWENLFWTRQTCCQALAYSMDASIGNHASSLCRLNITWSLDRDPVQEPAAGRMHVHAPKVRRFLLTVCWSGFLHSQPIADYDMMFVEYPLQATQARLSSVNIRMLKKGSGMHCMMEGY